MKDYRFVHLPQFQSLSPFMSDLALKIHLEQHHFVYEDKLKLMLSKDEYSNMSLDEIITKFPNNSKIVNCAKQIFNHNIFWQSMKLNSNNDYAKKVILEHISLEDIINASNNIFGSGWIWCVLKDNKITLITSPNAEIPAGKILFNIDLWEHAYYIDFQSNRTGFISCFFKYLLNWEFVANNLK